MSSIASAIKDAVTKLTSSGSNKSEKVENQETQQVEETQDEETQETEEDNSEDQGENKDDKKKVSKKKENKDDDEDDLTDDDRAAAYRIYKILNDPKVARDFVANLAKQAGLIQDKTDKSSKQVTKSVVEILKDELGEDNEFLAEKLGKAVEKILNEREEKITQRITEKEANEQISKINSAVDTFFENNPEAEKFASKMLKLMEEMPPTDKIKVDEYVSRIYTLASGKQAITKKVASKIEKMKENLKEAKTNVSSDVDESRIRKGPAHPTPRQAVEAAMKGIKFED